MPIKKITVRENGKEQTILIACTEEEAKDKSYIEYLELAEKEKTAEQLRKQPARPQSKISPSDKREAIRELIDFRNRKRAGQRRKYN